MTLEEISRELCRMSNQMARLSKELLWEEAALRRDTAPSKAAMRKEHSILLMNYARMLMGPLSDKDREALDDLFGFLQVADDIRAEAKEMLANAEPEDISGWGTVVRLLIERDDGAHDQALHTEMDEEEEAARFAREDATR